MSLKVLDNLRKTILISFGNPSNEIVKGKLLLSKINVSKTVCIYNISTTDQEKIYVGIYINYRANNICRYTPKNTQQEFAFISHLRRAQPIPIRQCVSSS